MCTYQGVRNVPFPRKNWRALFSCYLRFEIHPFLPFYRRNWVICLKCHKKRLIFSWDRRSNFLYRCYLIMKSTLLNNAMVRNKTLFWMGNKLVKMRWNINTFKISLIYLKYFNWHEISHRYFSQYSLLKFLWAIWIFQSFCI